MSHNLTLVNSERDTVSHMSFIPQKSLTAGNSLLKHIDLKQNDGDYNFFS